MSLDNVGAILAFLGLVAPGLVFELLRERRRPAVSESAFREAGRVALTSLIFTVVSLAILGVVRLVTSPSPSNGAAPSILLPDPAAWLAGGNTYLASNYHLVALALLIEVVLACGLAVSAHAVLSKAGFGRARIMDGSIWFHAMRSHVPNNATHVMLHLRLTDGTRVKGVLRRYTHGEKLDDQELLLGGDTLELARPGGDFVRIGSRSDFLIVRGERIAVMSGVYIAKDPQDRMLLFRRGQKDNVGAAIDTTQAVTAEVDDGAAQ